MVSPSCLAAHDVVDLVLLRSGHPVFSLYDLLYLVWVRPVRNAPQCNALLRAVARCEGIFNLASNSRLVEDAVCVAAKPQAKQ
jgi:hypothetical protein